MSMPTKTCKPHNDNNGLTDLCCPQNSWRFECAGCLQPQKSSLHAKNQKDSPCTAKPPPPKIPNSPRCNTLPPPVNVSAPTAAKSVRAIRSLPAAANMRTGATIFRPPLITAQASCIGMRTVVLNGGRNGTCRTRPFPICAKWRAYLPPKHTAAFQATCTSSA